MLHDPLPSPDLKQRVLAAAAATPARSRDAVRARSATIAAAATLLVVVLFLLAGGIRPSPRPGLLIAETAAGAAAIAAVAMWAAYGRGRSMLGRPAIVLAALCVLTPASLLAWKILVSAADPSMTVEWPDRIGYACLRVTLLLAAAPLLAVFAIRRHSDPSHPRLAGTSLGVAAAAGAWVLTDLWCPVAYVPHLLLGHVLPIAILATLGAIAGGRILYRRAA